MQMNDRRTGLGEDAETAEGDPARPRAAAHPAGHSGEGGDGSSPHAASAADALRGVARLVAEVREYGAHYVSATLDQWKVVARNVGVYAVLGVIALLAGAAVVVTSVVLLLVGLAIAIGKAFEPDQFWAGALIVAVVVLGGLGVSVVVGLKWISRTSRAALVKKYEERQRQQRVAFGHDVRGRDADPSDAVRR